MFKETSPVHHKYSAYKDFSPANSIVSANIYPALTNIISGFNLDNRMRKLYEPSALVLLSKCTFEIQKDITYILFIFRKFFPALMAWILAFFKKSSIDTVVVFVVLPLGFTFCFAVCALFSCTDQYIFLFHLKQAVLQVRWLLCDC